MTYSIRSISADGEFTALASQWQELLRRSEDANTFLSHAWLHSWWTCYRPDAKLRILLCEKGGQLRGIAPMMISREGLAGRLFRRMRFVGDGTSETDHMNFIVDQEEREQILASLLSAIEDIPWDIAHFNHIPESSQNAVQLLRHADERRWLISTQTAPCPRRSLPHTAEELMAALPSRLRTAIRSARRDLFNQHAVEFGLVTKKDELREALDELYRNHAGRWQAKGETGVFVDSRKRSFYEVLSQRLLDEGALRFFYLRVDGKIAAQQYCFEHDGTVMLLQEGFDIDMSKKNVGNVLRAMVLEHLIDHGSTAYDFLAGTSRHKRSWSDSAPADVSVRACRPSMMGRVAYWAPRWLARFKRPTPVVEAGAV